MWADLKYVNDNQWVDDDADDDGGDDHGGDDGDKYGKIPKSKFPKEVFEVWVGIDFASRFPPRHLEASRIISDIRAHHVCNNHPKFEMFHRSFMH